MNRSSIILFINNYLEKKVILFMEKQLNEFSIDPGENLALFRIEMDRKLRQLTTKRLKLAKEQAKQRATDYEQRAMDLEQYKLLFQSILERKTVDELKNLVH